MSELTYEQWMEKLREVAETLYTHPNPAQTILELCSNIPPQPSLESQLVRRYVETDGLPSGLASGWGEYAVEEVAADPTRKRILKWNGPETAGWERVISYVGPLPPHDPPPKQPECPPVGTWFDFEWTAEEYKGLKGKGCVTTYSTYPLYLAWTNGIGHLCHRTCRWDDVFGRIKITHQEPPSGGDTNNTD